MRMQPVTRVQLATLPEVQTDTKMTDEQKKLAASLKEKLDAKRAEMRQAGGGGGGGGGAGRGEMAKLNAELDGELVAKLDDTQKKRFSGLLLQTNGPAALTDAEVAKSLGLSSETVEKLKKVNEENMAARREAMQAAQGGGQEEMMAAMTKFNEKSNTALLGVLSDAEKKTMEELKGTKLEIDMAPLRPRRPQQ